LKSKPKEKGNNRSCSNRTGFHSRHAGTTETCVGTREMIASEKLSSPRTSTLGFPSAVEGIPCREKQQVLAVKEEDESNCLRNTSLR
jgi:hypothetical protein